MSYLLTVCVISSLAVLQAHREMRGAAVPAVSPAFFVSAKGERLRADQVYGLVKKNLAKVTTLKKSPFGQFLYTSDLHIYYIPPSFESSE